MFGTEAVKEANKNRGKHIGHRQGDLSHLSSGASQLLLRPWASLPLCGSWALSVRCFLAGLDWIGN